MSIPLTRGRQACLAIGMIVMLGAAALAVALLLTISQRDPALEFQALFRDALARGSTDDSFPVARFARRYDVCAYGASDPLTERRVARFFELVRNETWMQPNLSFRAKVSECPETTFFYIFHHDGEGGSARATLDDLMFITARHDMALPADHLRYIPAHLPGFVVTLGVPGKPPPESFRPSMVSPMRSQRPSGSLPAPCFSRNFFRLSSSRVTLRSSVGPFPSSRNGTFQPRFATR